MRGIIAKLNCLKLCEPPVGGQPLVFQATKFAYREGRFMTPSLYNADFIGKIKIRHDRETNKQTGCL
jgi:hypothetical protein